ncbi:CASP C terminal-domain-containing protein [Gorgonomyces haynaldii]|nr:CASP C terminal-domain-containing protein [Gorgonomyces haynaldii]
MDQLQFDFLASKKVLADKTKEFKQSSGWQEMKPLVRLYQQEIDSLTKYIKQVQDTLLDTLKRVQELESVSETDLNKQIQDLTDKHLKDTESLKALEQRLETLKREYLQQLEEQKALWLEQEQSLNARIQFLSQNVKNQVIVETRVDTEQVSRLSDKIRELQTENQLLKERDVISLNDHRQMTQQLQEKLDSILLMNDKLQKQAIETQKAQVSSQNDNLRLSAELKELQEQLEAKKDYDSISNELKMIKAIQFPDLDTQQPIETLLVEKSKRTEQETVELKYKIQELESHLLSLESEQASKDERLAEQKQLIERLEKDLQSLDKPQKSLDALMGQDSMTNILTQQRNRYKQRYEEVEAENKKMQLELQHLNDKIQSLNQDNLKMFEKIRYMEFKSNPLENRYRQVYEDNLDPFRQNTGGENDR